METVSVTYWVHCEIQVRDDGSDFDDRAQVNESELENLLKGSNFKKGRVEYSES